MAAEHVDFGFERLTDFGGGVLDGGDDGFGFGFGEFVGDDGIKDVGRLVGGDFG